MSEIELQDAILRHSLELMRLSAGEQAKAETILRELERELKLLLMSRELSAASKAEIRALIAEAEAVINPAYATAAKALDTHALALIVAERTVEVLEDVIPANVLMPSQEVLASLTKDVLIDGAPSSAWWSKQGEDTAFRFAAQVRQGVINGETNERIVARIVGRGPDAGILDVARRNARALVHSSVMSAANDARLATFRRNDRIIAGVRWLSALDGHVCWTAETLILMADGSERPVSEIREGDYVIGGVTGDACRVELAVKRVVPSTVVIHKNGHVVGRCTADHPVLTPSGWREIGSVSLSADLPQRKVLCRRSEAAECSVSSTRDQRGKRVALRTELRVAKTRQAGNEDHREGRGLFDSLRNGNGPDPATRDESSERLQHDAGRRGCSEPAVRNAGGERQATFGAVLERSRLPGEDEGGASNRCREGGDHPTGVVSDAGGQGFDRCPDEQSGMAGKYQGGAASADDPRGSREDRNGDCSELERPRLSGAGERGAGYETSRASGRSGMESQTSCEVRGDNAPQVARPGLSCEDGRSEAASAFAGIAGACCGGQTGEYVSGETLCDGEEIVGHPEGVSSETIVGIVSAAPAEVYTLTIEGDPTYVAGGIIVHNCARCAALDGQSWDLDGNKLTGTKVEFQAPPIHWNDRCVLSPIPKSFRDIGLNIEEPTDEGTRASSLGPVAGGTTFAEFFTRLSAAQQDKQFGPARAALFRAGKITIKDLVSGTGRELTLEELRP